jgi:hypothetical protein
MRIFLFILGLLAVAGFWLAAHHLLGVFAAVVVVLAVLHLAGGARRHGQHRARGLRPSLRYTYGMGWWGSVRLPGGFRVGHRI